LPARDIVVGVTAGDPAGIGPEVACRALMERYDGIVPILICREEVVADLSFAGAEGVEPAFKLRHLTPEKDCLNDMIAADFPLSAKGKNEGPGRLLFGWLIGHV